TVADARFAKPLDGDLIQRLARNHEVLITIEEGSIGGFGSFVLQRLASEGLFDRGLKVRQMGLPDEFIEHDKPEKMYERAGLNAAGVVPAVLETPGRKPIAKSLGEGAGSSVFPQDLQRILAGGAGGEANRCGRNKGARLCTDGP